MTERTFNPFFAGFCISYVSALVSWNNAEKAAQEMLEGLANGGVAARIAIYQMGSASLVDALKTMASFYETLSAGEIPQKYAEHIRHFVCGFEVLRAYRNFYVHQLRGLQITDADCSGYLWDVDVKGGYRWTSGKLELQALVEFAEHCKTLETYGGAVVRAISPLPKDPSLSDLEMKASLPSLQKPLWPKMLAKNRRNLLAQ